ncbi:hypothetical protein B0H14DRAFT_2575853 [Mycena olivaceomarginata]|nr:hypothetical protein B0H14DRAFT_2575853 [Mycena olivaceomarginata]
MGANNISIFSTPTIQETRSMPAQRNRRLGQVVTTSHTNPAPIAVILPSPDPYPSDGPSVNYLVTRDLVADVDAYAQGIIYYQSLIVHREIKLGESRDFEQHQHRYGQCQHLYRHEWKALYTTPEHKLTEHLVQDDMCFARRPCTVCSCHKRHTEWVDYLSAGGEQGVENDFFHWIALLYRYVPLKLVIFV